MTYISDKNKKSRCVSQQRKGVLWQEISVRMAKSALASRDG